MAKTYEARERRLCYEWVVEKHPTALQWRNVRLGELPKGEAVYGVVRRFADIIFYDDDVIHIVEASIRPDILKIAQLEMYGRLFPQTPEFTLFKDKAVKLIFLTTLEDKAVREEAERKGIEYVVYRPDWVTEYWEAKMAES